MRIRNTLMVLWILWTAVPVSADQLLYLKQGAFGTVVVTQQGSIRKLSFRQPEGDLEQSRCDIRDPDRLLHEYNRMQLLGLLLCPDPRRVLVVGLGGGSLSKALARLLPAATIDSIEIDPVVADVARRFFFYREGPQVRTFVEDARVYVERTDAEYDLIVLDAFDGLEIPEPLRTLEFYRALEGRLAPGGVVMANLHLPSDLYSSDRNTLAAVFPNQYAFLGTAQVVLACHRSPARHTREQLLERARSWPGGYPLEDYCRTLGAAEEWDRGAPILMDASPGGARPRSKWGNPSDRDAEPGNVRARSR
ncbi:MAG: fused MFS/spermidine synthase [Armatimonadetes bacterium]|nr:fused MFS/spermidine synthase [Armatimonadota bacterium]